MGSTPAPNCLEARNPGRCVCATEADNLSYLDAVHKPLEFLDLEKQEHERLYELAMEWHVAANEAVAARLDFMKDWAPRPCQSPELAFSHVINAKRERESIVLGNI